MRFAGCIMAMPEPDPKHIALAEADARALLIKHATGKLRIHMWDLVHWNPEYLDVLEEAAMEAVRQVKKRRERT